MPIYKIVKTTIFGTISKMSGPHEDVSFIYIATLSTKHWIKWFSKWKACIIRKKNLSVNSHPEHMMNCKYAYYSNTIMEMEKIGNKQL